MVLGINGAQGTGKSTVADFLRHVLTTEFARHVAVISLDDLYLTQAERQRRATDVHPLLATRGVPGTHAVNLGVDVIQRLQALEVGESMTLPRFDKAQDDRLPRDQWPNATGPIDLVILEGWCISSPPGGDDELDEPINALESEHDATGAWRRFVNDALRVDYGSLFELIDALLVIQAPSFDAISDWRLKQEHKLRQRAGNDAPGVMSEAAVLDFIQYFERITRRNLKELPAVADAVIQLNHEHQAISLSLDSALKE